MEAAIECVKDADLDKVMGPPSLPDEALERIALGGSDGHGWSGKYCTSSVLATGIETSPRLQDESLARAQEFYRASISAEAVEAAEAAEAAQAAAVAGMAAGGCGCECDEESDAVVDGADVVVEVTATN